MVELFLFLGTISLFFFLPVDFHFFYQKTGVEDTLILEMVFLKGLLRRRKVLSPKEGPASKNEKTFGRWFWIRKRQVKAQSAAGPAQESAAPGRQREQKTVPAFWENIERIQQFLGRYRELGLGVTLLSYFLPARYHHWLLVSSELEKKGFFQKFYWSTQFGTGNPVSTALGYGVLWGLKAGISGYLHRKIKFKTPPRLSVVPDFITAKWDTVFDCIFRIKLGYIIIAALIGRFRVRMKEGGVGIE
ncbi:MAG: DUF2953 domain-containing protein [Firmicutes bacterium]|nr:DUF2953 domain-containing protein [Bacillota bacterium]